MEDTCKICYSGSEDGAALIRPCLCKGSAKYVHHDCIRQWIKVSAKTNCELCKYIYKIESKVKPIYKWEMTHTTELSHHLFALANVCLLITVNILTVIWFLCLTVHHLYNVMWYWWVLFDSVMLCMYTLSILLVLPTWVLLYFGGLPKSLRLV